MLITVRGLMLITVFAKRVTVQAPTRKRELNKTIQGTLVKYKRRVLCVALCSVNGILRSALTASGSELVLLESCSVDSVVVCTHRLGHPTVLLKSTCNR